MTTELQEQLSKLLIRTTEPLSERGTPAPTPQACADVPTMLLPQDSHPFFKILFLWKVHPVCNARADDMLSEKTVDALCISQVTARFTSSRLAHLQSSLFVVFCLHS